MLTRKMEFQKYVQQKLEELENKLATKNCIEDLKNIISKQNDVIMNQGRKIEELESTISVLQASVKVLKSNVEENEQYGRRLCLRIDGIFKQ